MKRLLLNKNWRMRRAGSLNWLPAVVPGTVYTDLLRCGEMKDPFWKDEEDNALALMEYDYEYETTFEPGEEWRECEEKRLLFSGVDTVADIFLNGEILGSTQNMHRAYEFSVEGRLRPGENTLGVILHSPNRYIREKFAACPTLGSEDAMDGFVHIRKAHCMFGWDWGAHLPDAGIFRPVALLGTEGGRILDVHIVQDHSEDRVSLKLDVRTETAGKAKAGLEPEYRVVLTDPDGEKRSYPHSPESIHIEDPKLWWPNGYGQQNLYTVEVILEGRGTLRELDRAVKRIGLRTMNVHRERDEWGESFAHEVNGRTVFAMGADYIPEDHLLGRVGPERTRRLLKDCKEANFNVIRVWGGGYYPDDWFFDICDELGLMVWQDFMFACAVYELTDEFRENIRLEFIDNVKRIRHHACLALWCGNNEMEQFVSEGHHWVTKHTEVRDYILMYEQLIPEVLREYDPRTFYWPASPSSGGSFDEPNDPDRGDVHYWQVWHGSKPFSEYRKYFFRYASEFGFQSFPSRRTIECFTDDEADMNPFSYVMERHQRNYGANGKIMNYLQQTYLYPNSFDAFIYVSQLLQADAIRYGVEHFRRNRGRCMGAVYWQLNDCWPVISWSSIDYCGRWKALHYYARRFFAPYLVSCQEEGLLTQDEKRRDFNRQHFCVEPSIRLSAVNETLEDGDFFLRWELRDAGGEILRQESGRVAVPALSALWLEKIPLPEADIFENYVSYAMYRGEERVSEGTVIFSLPKYFHYRDPGLAFSVEGDEIVVSARAYAKSVEILNGEEDLVLSDNYFDLNADSKRVRILRGEPSGIRLRSVYDIR